MQEMVMGGAKQHHGEGKTMAAAWLSPLFYGNHPHRWPRPPSVTIHLLVFTIYGHFQGDMTMRLPFGWHMVGDMVRFVLDMATAWQSDGHKYRDMTILRVYGHMHAGYGHSQGIWPFS